MCPEILTFDLPTTTGHRKLYSAIRAAGLIIYYGTIAKCAPAGFIKHQSHEIAEHHGFKFELKIITTISQSG